MSFDLDQVCGDFLQIADGRQLSLGSVDAGTRALTIATDADWAECLEHARREISCGGRRVEDGQTWEEALARVAAVQLRRGVLQPRTRAGVAMGRTPDAAEWAAQRERWTDLLFEIAARGSADREQGYQQLDAAEPEFLTRAEFDARSQPTGHVPAFRDTGLVMTPRGKAPLGGIPRSMR